MHSLEQLLQSQSQLWRGNQHPSAQRTAPTGRAALDAFLPGGGWPLGALTELLSPGPGSGELSLTTPALARATASGQRVALVAPPVPPYPPALAAAGVDLSQLWVITPELGNSRQAQKKAGKEALWAAEQLLRSGSFAAVLVWLPQATPTQLRRLQLAAETGGSCWALAYRPARSAAESSPAALRLQWDSQLLSVLKCRGGNPGQLQLEPQTPPPHTPAHHWPRAANDHQQQR